MLQRVWSSFWNIEITFAIFIVEGKFPVEKDILAIKDIVSEDVVDLLFFRFFFSESHSPAFVGLINNDCLLGFLR